jgi:hypothetical protein
MLDLRRRIWNRPIPAFAMFLQLCGGGVVPDPRGKLEYAGEHGKEPASAVEKALNSSVTPLIGEMRKRRVRAADLLKLYSEGNLTHAVEFPIQGVRFGDGLTIFALD